MHLVKAIKFKQMLRIRNMFSNLSINTIVILFILADANNKGINENDTIEVIVNALKNNENIFEAYKNTFYE